MLEHRSLVLFQNFQYFRLRTCLCLHAMVDNFSGSRLLDASTWAAAYAAIERFVGGLWVARWADDHLPPITDERDDEWTALLSFQRKGKPKLKLMFHLLDGTTRQMFTCKTCRTAYQLCSAILSGTAFRPYTWQAVETLFRPFCQTRYRLLVPISAGLTYLTV